MLYCGGDALGEPLFDLCIVDIYVFLRQRFHTACFAPRVLLVKAGVLHVDFTLDLGTDDITVGKGTVIFCEVILGSFGCVVSREEAVACIHVYHAPKFVINFIPKLVDEVVAAAAKHLG